MNPAGDAIYSGNPEVVGKNYSDRSYFREIANGREWAVSELVISRATGKPVFGYLAGYSGREGHSAWRCRCHDHSRQFGRPARG